MSRPQPAGEEQPPAHLDDVPPVPSAEEVAAELEAVADPADPADPAAPVGEEPEDRRHPSTVGGLLYLFVLAAGATGVFIAWSGDWRLGVRWIGGALVGAATFRLVLPRRDAGMLAVRHRLLDCLLLGGVGAVLLFLAQTIPNQPGT
ncbi:DUF3017 domain-containing protein [Nocardioides kribbensis]|uniref:DUF3017 domain-containing protein n=1 Tax=Nocardioides kribbensis TaxID=305517 RepID=UPI0032DA8386